MESVSIENYLKAIYQLSDASGDAPSGGARPANWLAA